MHTEPRSLWRRRRTWLACLLAGPASVAFGSLWENPNWALTGTLAGAVGYDSNLTLSRNGPSDTYIQARPQLRMARRNSSTDLHALLGLTSTEFLHGRQPTQTDLRFTAGYGYPFGPDIPSRYTSKFSWQRTSEPDQYLGQRVRHDRAEISGEGYFPLSGKLGLRGEVDAYHDKYKDQALNTNSRVRAFTGLAYELRPRLQTSFNVGYAEGRSRPRRTDLMGRPVNSEEIYFTARARGEITAKITGSVYAGMGRVRYDGGYTNSYNLPVAGADLTWGLDPRRTVVLAGYSGADYAPDGQAVDTSRAFLSYTHVIVGQWQYILRGGPTRTVFRREVRQSTDTAWEGGVEFGYTPSDRFRVSFGIVGSRHKSDVRERQYERTAFSLDSTYRF